MKRSTVALTLLSLLLFAWVGLAACGSHSGFADQQNTSAPNETQRKAMGLTELIAQLKTAGAQVVAGADINEPFMDVQGHTLTVNGEHIQVYEFASVSDTNKQASRVSPDGTSFTTVSSIGSSRHICTKGDGSSCPVSKILDTKTG